MSKPGLATDGKAQSAAVAARSRSCSLGRTPATSRARCVRVSQEPFSMSRRILVAMLAIAWTVPAFAQTQPTRPSAYATLPTLRSAWPTAPLNPCPRFGLNPTSSCYSGTNYPSYSALAPFEFSKPNSKPKSKGSDNLYQDEARLRIEEKGYYDVTNLDKDSRGIWRGNARLEDGRTVDVTLDLEGNIYSVPTRLQIRIKPPPPDR
jgi:hypothetical protein